MFRSSLPDSNYARLVAPSTESPLFAWSESILLTIVMLAIIYVFFPDDPMLHHAPFPWPWLLPLVLALRYGFIASLLSGVIITAALALHEGSHTLTLPFYRHYLLGGFILAILASEFHSVWQNRLYRAEQTLTYEKNRLEKLARRYFVTMTSHQQLEQSLIHKPVTLRSATEAIRELIQETGGEMTTQVAERLIDLLTHYCHINQASLYLKTDDGWQPSASTHAPKPLNTNDPLVNNALEAQTTSYVSVNKLNEFETSDYLAIVVMTTSSDELLGLLVIEDMPFLSFTHASLQMITIMLCYYADELRAYKLASELVKTIPCDVHFGSECVKLKRIFDNYNIPSTIVRFTIKHDDKTNDIIQQLHERRRGLDVVWERADKDHALTDIFILMPFTDTIMYEGFRKRIATWLENQYNIVLDKDTVSITNFMFAKGESINAMLQRIMYHG